MNRTTTGLCLAALLVSCSMNSVLRADELVMQDNLFVADETRHQWVNEHNGRTGLLLVSGALLSSPCTLETNEVELPLQKSTEGIMTRYALKLNLLGCGDGGALVSGTSVAGRDNMMVMQSALLTGVEGGLLQPDQRMLSTGRAVVFGGANQFTYWLSEAQQQALVGQQTIDRAQGKTYMNPRDNNALLRLRLDYE
ncbi:TPA: nuclease PIN [Salmonella enterica subsp. enterica serovar Mississippi]|nr:nuclease PIN [Salmonella enterica subsp. enterica]ECW0788954.1 nuclease PIN [Salmonella enterica subsp. enterica]HED0168015.1 nuclease PIN [Salmonella enterica subsp. enterica serovar Mississippi]HED0173879.1 nuclease PIN [Salmonella enterica subsp. enterica serovar Mississippi]HED0195874.1 nuclease PIN [Salmonella enterica subsp. enterica serovar Mississippi]